jgi:hypothetical protein
VKKEDIIKRAAERGITIDAETAEKYINLSEEELLNLDVSGGKCLKQAKEKMVLPSEAQTCNYYSPIMPPSQGSVPNCQFCKYIKIKMGVIGDLRPPTYCTNGNVSGWC